MTSISIIGTGKMGSAIAEVSARAGASIQIIRRRAGAGSAAVAGAAATAPIPVAIRAIETTLLTTGRTPKRVRMAAG